ncbi:LysR family transcriptional regulator [Mesobacillus selenatarsenatis]|uniref:LysR family transcriptional regulator YeiE n=1 Tax=Mesobacillus selenatarsenatis (strain DSM 18680 / JCM 14380 / FERM P-15431 / SF-1) TaxID=1321606 RepID=A0A0A8WX37_MESS1|nr:LysR family transcriptional regulator [Mesobacillus selenatarsenatis]GAM12225.1 LysR family transcriptional regulator YeiE [Mesobacillus selenatarsenatis SF-1]
MDFHQLKSFYYVANYLNFSKAAEKVSLSQPAVSRQIEALEVYYKLSLFTRSGRKVELTDAGRRLLQYTEKILLLTEETDKAMTALTNLETGEIKVGACTTVGNYIMPPLIIDFQNKYENIKVDLVIDQTDIILEKLKKGKLDVAIAAKANNDPEFNYKAILKDELVLVAGKGARMDGISSIHQLKNQAFFLRKKGSNTREHIDQLFELNEFRPTKVFEFDTNEAILQSIKKSRGIGFLPQHVLHDELESGQLEGYEIQEKSHRSFSIISPKEKFISPSLLILSNYIKKNIFAYI